MWIAIGVIALSVIMLVGPIMMVKPTPGQRALSELRSAAQKKGLRVSMVPNPIGSDPAFLANYGLARLDSGEGKPIRPWKLVRKGFEHEMHFCGQWDWADENQALPNIAAQLPELLQALPASVCAVERNRLWAGIVWSEQRKGQETDDILELFLHTLQVLNKVKD
ncbi:hypothetical protein [Saccharophagus degradans]|uniref:Uncharacterized protein n=1 Tax=Saccharophagus degradans TaxID=86304 RepID=A0AAW7X952_9GAMM|nr:hypothetical protein [Saccharophagus degradans]MDO6424142.1 hypothetical protein [Saccharophagus degradans]MDO6608189.1 hypothetical protein [Saccharophagus degradans]